MKFRHVMLIVWTACALLSAGFMNKSLQSDDFRWSTKQKCEEWANRHRSFSVIWSALGGPVTFVVTMAMTGFGYQGWSLEINKCEGYR